MEVTSYWLFNLTYINFKCYTIKIHGYVTLYYWYVGSEEYQYKTKETTFVTSRWENGIV